MFFKRFLCSHWISGSDGELIWNSWQVSVKAAATRGSKSSVLQDKWPVFSHWLDSFFNYSQSVLNFLFWTNTHTSQNHLTAPLPGPPSTTSAELCGKEVVWSPVKVHWARISKMPSPECVRVSGTVLKATCVVSSRQIGVAYITATSTALATAVGLNLYTKVQLLCFLLPSGTHPEKHDHP